MCPSSRIVFSIVATRPLELQLQSRIRGKPVTTSLKFAHREGSVLLLSGLSRSMTPSGTLLKGEPLGLLPLRRRRRHGKRTKFSLRVSLHQPYTKGTPVRCPLRFHPAMSSRPMNYNTWAMRGGGGVVNRRPVFCETHDWEQADELWLG